jgi:hypothetical protein
MCPMEMRNIFFVSVHDNKINLPGVKKQSELSKDEKDLINIEI